MKKSLEKYIKKIENNKLSADEIRDLKSAREGSVKKKVFWGLQEIARRKKKEYDYFQQMKYQRSLLKEE